MQILDLELTVPGCPAMDTSIREYLRNAEGFERLTHSMQKSVFGQVAPFGLFTAEIQGSAIVISEDWVVSIHGKKLINCVLALSVLLNVIGQRINAPVEVKVSPYQVGSDEPLHRVIGRQAKRSTILGYIEKVVFALLGAALGVVLTLIVQWIISGSLLK